MAANGDTHTVPHTHLTACLRPETGNLKPCQANEASLMGRGGRERAAAIVCCLLPGSLIVVAVVVAACLRHCGQLPVPCKSLITNCFEILLAIAATFY